MAEKIIIDMEKGIYTYPECPDTEITDICKDSLLTGVKLELFKVQYKQATEYVVLRDNHDGGETWQRKTLKAAQNKYTKLIEEELC